MVEWTSIIKNSIVRIVCLIILAGLISTILLSCYVFCFNYSGTHIINDTKATDYKWEPYQKKAGIKEGYSSINLDGDGFNNDHVADTVDILVQGSSHMEASYLAKNKNMSHILSERLAGKEVYNIGMSGHTIYTCVQNIKYAMDYYRPSEYIILETDRINLDRESMNQVVDESYPEIPSYDSGIIYKVQKKFPVVKSIYKALVDWSSSDTVDGERDEEVYTDYTSKEYTRVLNQFLHKAAEDSSASATKLIIFYHPTTNIDEKREMINATDPDALAAFQKACNDNGIIFVDMTEDFERLYDEEHILAHGFINTAVGEGHLNQYGHRVIAERLAEVIGGEE